MKKARKQMKGLIGTGLTLGTGAVALGALGSTSGVEGVGKIGAVLPTVGTIMGAGMVLRSTELLNPNQYKKKRRK